MFPRRPDRDPDVTVPAGDADAGTGEGVRELHVPPAHAGQRLDNFLAGRLKGVPRTWIYRAVRRGEVRVNGGRARPDRRLEAGDRVRVPPVRTATTAPSAPPHALALRLAARVLHEDDDLLVIDKPSGVAVHGGSGRSHGVIEALRHARGDPPFLELVHRLDKDTSGCLLLAKRRSSLLALHAALREGRVDKRYLALLKGRWSGTRDVEAPLRRSVLGSGERVVRARAEGKAALTRLRGLRPSARASLVEARPRTGRTHQIRVHAAVAGHPIAGDPKYGDRAFNREMATLGLRRLFLHASTLVVPHPASGRRLRLDAPLPAELASVLDRLGLGAARGGAPSGRGRTPLVD